jgi:hypothetical protein
MMNYIGNNIGPSRVVSAVGSEIASVFADASQRQRSSDMRILPLIAALAVFVLPLGAQAQVLVQVGPHYHHHYWHHHHHHHWHRHN